MAEEFKAHSFFFGVAFDKACRFEEVPKLLKVKPACVSPDGVPNFSAKLDFVVTHLDVVVDSN